MTTSQKKKKEIEKKMEAIEQRLDRKFQVTKEAIELGKSPQKLVSKRPFTSLFLIFGLGFLTGKRIAASLTIRENTSDIQSSYKQTYSKNSDHLEQGTVLISDTVIQRVKKRIKQKILDSFLNYAEELLNGYMRKANSGYDTESK